MTLVPVYFYRLWAVIHFNFYRNFQNFNDCLMTVLFTHNHRNLMSVWNYVDDDGKSLNVFSHFGESWRHPRVNYHPVLRQIRLRGSLQLRVHYAGARVGRKSKSLRTCAVDKRLCWFLRVVSHLPPHNTQHNRLLVQAGVTGIDSFNE